MSLLDLFSKKEKLPEVSNQNLVAVVKGEMIAPDQIEDKVFANETLGKTIGFIPSSNEFVSPCNGTLEVMFPTGHAFAIRMQDGTGVLVHIGINTVDLQGHGFKVLAKQGAKVQAGQKIVEADLAAIQAAGYSMTTMLIITEPTKDEYVFSSFGLKEKAEIIL
ncbi:PTS sugar transporter subunit IIA [Dielma fastidiosa]|uniref:PTS sugar transporter subunit IIA n=1 Tax=Dielma fastidiosa TaxID=1034346 RepID=UPI0023F385CF|nr:PTS glucose transporter subunit IIA [Dielma fastidiosa]